MSEQRQAAAQVRAELGGVDYVVELQAGRHRFLADEPAGLGGTDAGPGPFPLLLSGLAACTAITLRMYAKRKGWNLTNVHVDTRLAPRQAGAQQAGLHIDRSISLQGELDASQRARLLDVSERTPVTLALKGGMQIHTTLAGPEIA